MGRFVQAAPALFQSLELPRTRQAPGIARRWLAGFLASEPDGLMQQKAMLLVSELVTNAVVHGRGRIELRAELDGDRLLVEVDDEGPGFTPTDGARDPGVAGGHGLRIVEEEASRWGIRKGKADVWFELPRPSAANSGGRRGSHERRGRRGQLGRTELPARCRGSWSDTGDAARYR